MTPRSNGKAVVFLLTLLFLLPLLCSVVDGASGNKRKVKKRVRRTDVANNCRGTAGSTGLGSATTIGTTSGGAKSATGGTTSSGSTTVAGVTLAQLQAALAGNCPTQTSGEMISCVDALPYINAAMAKYGLTDVGEKGTWSGSYLTCPV